MQAPIAPNAPPDSQKRILVVDDDDVFRAMLTKILNKRFAVEAAASGIEAIAACRKTPPDLVLMDIEMHAMDGYEASRRLREIVASPVMFVTGHDTLQTKLDAFAAGACDVVCKPIAAPVLEKKIDLTIRMHETQQQLREESRQLQAMAMNFLSNMGMQGVLLNFVRAAVNCRSYEALAEQLAAATRDLGLQTFGLIRHGGSYTVFRSEGQPTRLETDILGRMASIGRCFQFKKQFIVNYDRVSIIATNMPEEHPERAGQLRDDLAVLAETAEGLCDNVDMRHESAVRAEMMQVALGGTVEALESLRKRHRTMQADTRMHLQQLSDSIEAAHSWLNTTNQQERAINEMLEMSIRSILDLLAADSEHDGEFDRVLDALRGTPNAGRAELW